MPGSPPISTSEPFTMPPPRSLSTSVNPSDNLFSADESMSFRCSGLLPEAGAEDEMLLFLDGFPVTTVCSAIVFHSPQAGQRPIHLGLSFPQLVQNHIVFSFVPISDYFFRSVKIVILTTRHKKSSILSYLKVPQFLLRPFGRTGYKLNYSTTTALLSAQQHVVSAAAAAAARLSATLTLSAFA